MVCNSCFAITEELLSVHESGQNKTVCKINLPADGMCQREQGGTLAKCRRFAWKRGYWAWKRPGVILGES